MRILVRLIPTFICALLFTDCATYWSHRKNDLQDVFTFGVENPGYGVGVRLGPLAGGFVFQGGESAPGKRDLGIGYGLRGGNFGSYRSQQLIFGILGSDKFHSLPSKNPTVTGSPSDANPSGKTDSGSGENSGLLFPELPDAENPEGTDSEMDTLEERQKAKSYTLRYLQFYNIPIDERRRKKKEAFFRKYVQSLDPDKKNDALQAYLAQNPENKDDYPLAFLYQIEVYLGVRYGVRIGFNVAEFLDFILGFTGLDLLEDDIE
ncbi:hypothetical protein EHO61_05150 [Leptospira fluminis]|uniref:Uncharacterized protein n=1 Tax=Leptospira fluminis TaxID=2484979 RepID=A0A4R9GSX3_9LEPT|nr:hypothetical protein EHO61_05150 [Leptospira fluminis]